MFSSSQWRRADTGITIFAPMLILGNPGLRVSTRMLQMPMFVSCAACSTLTASGSVLIDSFGACISMGFALGGMCVSSFFSPKIVP
jgi:hypothetical protein